MKRQKGFAFIPLILIITAAILVSGGVVMYQKFDQSKKDEHSPRYFVVKELGIQFALSEEIKDLTYVMSPDKTFAHFSTRSLEIMSDNDCLADRAPLGSISINQQNLIQRGELPTNESEGFHHVNDMWVYYVSPQSTCSQNKEITDITIGQISALKNAFETVVTSGDVPIATIEPVSHETDDEIIAIDASWQVYMSEQYNFEFRHPEHVTVKEEGGVMWISPKEFVGDGYIFTIYSSDSPAYQTMLKASQKDKISESSYRLGDIPAKRIKAGFDFGGGINYILFANAGKNFIIMTDITPEQEKILSTFTTNTYPFATYAPGASYGELKTDLLAKGWTPFIPSVVSQPFYSVDMAYPEIGWCGNGVDAICHANFKRGNRQGHLNVVHEKDGMWIYVGNE